MPDRRVLLKGEEAIVLAAAVAGADLYGYPITPVTGVVEMASKLFPQVGRVFLQAESEVAAANMAYGASAVGQRILCVSSSPGFSLKQEAISYMCGAELPGVFVNAMRGGPGLGNIGASQADYFQATRGGGHGDYYTPVFAPSTVGETFEMTVEAFNVADRYRTPVMVIIDGSIAQATESVQLGAEASRLVERFAKPWAASGAAGRAEKNVVTSFRLEPIEALENLNLDLQAKYARIQRELGEPVERCQLDAAELLVVAYGSMAGQAEAAVRAARTAGIKAGLLRPKLLWPFPYAAVRAAAARARGVLVLEMSAGQMVEDVRLAVGNAREVYFYGRTGGMVPDEREIVEQIEQVAEELSRLPADELAASGRLLQGEHYRRQLPRPHEIVEPGRYGRDWDPPTAEQDVVVSRANAMDDYATHYCPGCGHGNLHQLIAHAIDELGLRDQTIMIEPVGCSVVTYWNVDTVQAAHGRGMAVGTAISRTRPDRVVISYQGDGDLASIGMAETLHAASRGEDFVLVFVNNCIYGMTGGQMAPTSIPGLPTTTCATGRDVTDVGTPIDMCKLFAQLDGVSYLERVALDGPAGLTKVGKAIRHALKLQASRAGGLKVVEVLSPCPVGWKMTPAEAHRYIKNVVSKHFPPGKFKDVADSPSPARTHPAAADATDLFNRADLHWVTPGRYGTPNRTRFPQPGLRIAGHGGQGIVLLSTLLVHAAVRGGERISLLPSYGSAMRGGTCNCQLRISSQTIASPYVSNPDVLVAMNQPSYEKFAPTVRPGGLLLFDSTLVTDPAVAEPSADVQRVGVAMTRIAAELGNERMANLVAAGVLVGLADLLDPQVVRDSIPEIFAHRPKLIEPNLAAFEAGLAHVGQLQSS